VNTLSWIVGSLFAAVLVASVLRNRVVRTKNARHRRSRAADLLTGLYGVQQTRLRRFRPPVTDKDVQALTTAFQGAMARAMGAPEDVVTGTPEAPSSDPITLSAVCWSACGTKHAHYLHDPRCLNHPRTKG